MDIPCRSPGVALGVVPTVVSALNPLTVQGDGVVEGAKKALISLAMSGCSREQAKVKSTTFPFSDMGQLRRWLIFWAKDVLSVTVWMCSWFLRVSILAKVQWW